MQRQRMDPAVPGAVSPRGMRAVPTLRERRRLATRAEISDAALGLFERQGLEVTTVQDIADAVGVSARTCFRYFPSKEEFVLTIHDEFDDALDAWLAGPPDDARLLRQIEDVYAGVIAEFGQRRATAVERLLRVRRLIVAEPSLRYAALRLDADRAAELTDRILATFPGRFEGTEVQIAVEIAHLELRVAFDQWAGHLESGNHSDLFVVHRTIRCAVATSLDAES